jgi:hypothetical protein
MKHSNVDQELKEGKQKESGKRTRLLPENLKELRK